jgi:hypothetical protein
VKDHYLRRLQRRCHNKDWWTLSLEEIMSRLSAAEVQFDAECVRAGTLRPRFLDRLAEDLAKKNGTTKEVELRKLNNVAKQKKQAARIRSARKKPSKGLVTKLTQETPTGTRVIQDQQELIDVSTQVNESRSTSCYPCVFLQDQLLAEIGILADGPAVPQILLGTYVPPPGTDPYTTLLLQELQMPEAVQTNPMPPTRISTENHQKGWRRQRVTKAAEPTAVPFSLHMAASYDELLADMDATLRSIPLEFGFSPQDFEQVTDAAIPKKANVLDADKMRNICLMNPAFNMNNKEFGRRLMAYNELHDLLADAQSGSHKKRRAAEVVLQKLLTWDLLRQKRRSGFLCSNNAMQCYDRIVHNVAMLAMLSRGADPVALRSLFETLQNAEHSIMTGYGTSKSATYGGKSRATMGLLPIMGILQGNDMGPFVWAIISSVLLHVMMGQGYAGLILTGVLTGLVLRVVVLG